MQYVQCKRPKADKEPAVRDEAAYEKDDTMDHRKLAARFRTRKNRIRRVLIAFDYHMRADLVTDATPTMAFELPGSIWQSEEAQIIWGGPDPLLTLAKRRMSLSMSRAGTPTDIGMRNARSSSSSWLELHVAPTIRWGRFFASC